MFDTSDINNFAPRIKYYLLEWIDHNSDLFHAVYSPDTRLCEMNKDEIEKLFEFAVNEDIKNFS